MSSRDQRVSGLQALRDFAVRAADTRRFGAAGEEATASTVLCHSNTVDSLLADDDPVEGTEQRILVTRVAAEKPANCLHRSQSVTPPTGPPRLLIRNSSLPLAGPTLGTGSAQRGAPTPTTHTLRARDAGYPPTSAMMLRAASCSSHPSRAARVANSSRACSGSFLWAVMIMP